MENSNVIDEIFDLLGQVQQEIPVSTEAGDGSVRELVYRCGVLDLDVEDSSERDGVRTVMAEVRSASGHRIHALLDILFHASGELPKTRLVVPVPALGGISVIEQGTPEFESWVKSAEEDVEGFLFRPYRYRYLDESRYERDHHVGDDGWSLL